MMIEVSQVNWCVFKVSIYDIYLVGHLFCMYNAFWQSNHRTGVCLHSHQSYNAMYCAMYTREIKISTASIFHLRTNCQHEDGSLSFRCMNGAKRVRPVLTEPMQNGNVRLTTNILDCRMYSIVEIYKSTYIILCNLLTLKKSLKSSTNLLELLCC